MIRFCRCLATAVSICLVTSLSFAAAEPPSAPRGVSVQREAGEQRLALDGDVFHRTSREVADARSFDVAGSDKRVVLWREIAEDGSGLPYYAISLEGDTIDVVRQTSYEIQLRHGPFDPLLAIPAVAQTLRAADDSRLHLIQFETQPLEDYRRLISSLGATAHKYVAGHAHFVSMSPQAREAIEALPFVRWVGPVHPDYKLEELLRRQIVDGSKVEPRRYSIMLHERGEEAQSRIVAAVKSLGGEVHGTTPRGFRVEATLSLDQLRRMAALDDVMFIDRKGRLETDTDIVRELGGADYLESVEGFTGQGVRGEVADTELDESHPEWSAPPIIHVAGSDIAHGTSVYGILFAQGANPTARGIIPDGIGIFAQSNGLLGGGATRYTHTAELVDPAGPYRTVFQTNSTGDPRTFNYTTISAEMDDILFINDIVITQSQSNAGNQDSRPQAWAKNILSGGAVEHYNTLTRTDDCWCSTGSIGPASDGRIKPDLSFFYDLTFAPSTGGGYTEFGGTSGATPSIAGYVGLFHQMWSEQLFGNDVPNPGGTVFENRPHMTTAKAALINTATQYEFTSSTDDLTRVHQGWGIPSVQYLYDIRDKIGFVDETEVLQNLETREFSAFVNAAEPELRVTMVFADPMGSPAASVHRINNLSLRVTSPNATVYWGNAGLLDGNWSVAGGSENTIDTVENVFVQNPEAGLWTVEVIASEINEDAHVETAQVDADFALVVSGADLTNCTSEGRVQLSRALYNCSDNADVRVVDCDLNTDDATIQTVSVTLSSTGEPGGETILLTETAPATADFRGSIPLDVANAAGVLQVSDGEIVTAIYLDADDGNGGNNITVTDTADVDCQSPQILNVAVTQVNPRSAVVTVDLDEDARTDLPYGLVCGAPDDTAASLGLQTQHDVALSPLVDETTYFFTVNAEDGAGNSVSDDNGGSCYSFTTPAVPDYFAEQFTAGVDLADSTITFTPNGTNDFYGFCNESSVTALPTDPTGGTDLGLSDDQPGSFTLTGGAMVHLYGLSYDTVWVGPNGYLTFGGGDSDYTEAFADHFGTPRVAALFDDLNPSTGGTVTWKQTGDRVAVTWDAVPEHSTSNSNTFQIEMFFDGRIRVTWLQIDAQDAIAGLSGGLGLDPDFAPTDLSGTAGCGPHPPNVSDLALQTAVDTPLAVSLAVSDDGLPAPPAIGVSIVRLPTYGTLIDDGTASPILTVPHVLAGGGGAVTYTPGGGVQGWDSFDYSADDGGVHPDGGSSAVAVVGVTVGGPQVVDEFLVDDTDPGWSTTGAWAFGAPTGGGSHNLDPTSGATGVNVYGYNLAGDYTDNMGQEFLTSTPVDLTGVIGTTLEFQRWLGVESASYDHATVEISIDGSSWSQLWDHTGGALNDGAWGLQSYDISGVADGQATVSFRWTMGTTDGSVTYPGWNIDDVRISGMTPISCAGAPAEVPVIRFGADKSTLVWTAASYASGGAPVYDVLRSDASNDFGASALCLESDDGDTSAADASTPAAGVVQHYLVRPENNCGVGPLGAGRSGRSCDPAP